MSIYFAACTKILILLIIFFYTRALSHNGHVLLLEAPAGNHGSCIHQNKYPVQVDEDNYHDSMQASFLKGIGHNASTKSNHAFWRFKPYSGAAWRYTITICSVLWYVLPLQNLSAIYTCRQAKRTIGKMHFSSKQNYMW